MFQSEWSKAIMYYQHSMTTAIVKEDCCFTAYFSKEYSAKAISQKLCKSGVAPKNYKIFWNTFFFSSFSRLIKTALDNSPSSETGMPLFRKKGFFKEKFAIYFHLIKSKHFRSKSLKVLEKLWVRRFVVVSNLRAFRIIQRIFHRQLFFFFSNFRKDFPPILAHSLAFSHRSRLTEDPAETHNTGIN